MRYRATTLAGRLELAQALLCPRDADTGELLPPLVSLDDARRLLDGQPLAKPQVDPGMTTNTWDAASAAARLEIARRAADAMIRYDGKTALRQLLDELGIEL